MYMIPYCVFSDFSTILNNLDFGGDFLFRTSDNISKNASVHESIFTSLSNRVGILFKTFCLSNG